jgi:hypothetical protein
MNRIWKSTVDDFVAEFVFEANLDASHLGWAEIVAYVNYYMVRLYLDVENAFIWVNGHRIALDEDVSADEERHGVQTRRLVHLDKLIKDKISRVLFQGEISAVYLPDATISDNIRKILGAFLLKQIISIMRIVRLLRTYSALIR